MHNLVIDFLVNQLDEGWEPSDTRLGGTERGIVEWAEALARRGNGCRIYRNGRRGAYIRNDVAYSDRQAYRGSGDITINVKCPSVAPTGPTLFFTNDVDANEQDLAEYDAVFQVSNWAKEHIRLNNTNVFVVPHGYDESRIYPGKKAAKQCLYASSPDRGLAYLLDVWPAVMRSHPDATLKVTYGYIGSNLRGVDFLGDVSEEAMNELYRHSDFWCHPASGGELQCIAGLKAQAAGCIPVIIPTMALAETVKHGYTACKEDYGRVLIDALADADGRNDAIRQLLASETYLTIEKSTDLLLEVINWVLTEHVRHTPRP